MQELGFFALSLGGGSVELGAQFFVIAVVGLAFCGGGRFGGSCFFQFGGEVKVIGVNKILYLVSV